MPKINEKKIAHFERSGSKKTFFISIECTLQKPKKPNLIEKPISIHSCSTCCYTFLLLTKLRLYPMIMAHMLGYGYSCKRYDNNLFCQQHWAGRLILKRFLYLCPSIISFNHLFTMPASKFVSFTKIVSAINAFISNHNNCLSFYELRLIELNPCYSQRRASESKMLSTAN